MAAPGSAEARVPAYQQAARLALLRIDPRISQSHGLAGWTGAGKTGGVSDGMINAHKTSTAAAHAHSLTRGAGGGCGAERVNGGSITAIAWPASALFTVKSNKCNRWTDRLAGWHA